MECLRRQLFEIKVTKDWITLTSLPTERKNACNKQEGPAHTWSLWTAWVRKETGRMGWTRPSQIKTTGGAKLHCTMQGTEGVQGFSLRVERSLWRFLTGVWHNLFYVFQKLAKLCRKVTWSNVVGKRSTIHIVCLVSKTRMVTEEMGRQQMLQGIWM